MSEATETEIKCIQESFEHFPQDVLQAMCEGQAHPRIPRRDWVEQYYLPVDQQDLLDEVVDTLNRQNISFGNGEEQAALAKVGAAQELRLLQKRKLGLYQITIKGEGTWGGYSCQQLETPEIASSAVRPLIENYRSRATGKVIKLWHDIVETIDGFDRIVEQDILTSHQNLIINETEVPLANPAEAVQLILQWKAEGKFPRYFGIDVTGRPELKNRRMAFTTMEQLPVFVQDIMHNRSAQDRKILETIIEANS